MSTRVKERSAARRAPARRRRRRALTWGIPAGVLAAIALVAVVTTLGGGGSGPSDGVRVDGPARSAPLRVGERIPDFSAPALDGGRITWSAYRDEPAVLAIWAPWCPYCAVEMERLADLAPQYDTTVVSLATWIGMRPGPSPEGFMQEAGAVFPTAVDDAEFTLAEAMGLQGTPLLYYVDAEGIVFRVVQGASTEREMRNLLSGMAG